MPDAEFKLVDQLIRESTLSARFYFSITSLFLCAAAAVVVTALHSPTPEHTKEMISAVIAIFGAIPLPLALAARSQRIGLMYLKERWSDAKAANDTAAIKKLRARFDQIEASVTQRGWGLGKLGTV